MMLAPREILNFRLPMQRPKRIPRLGRSLILQGKAMAPPICLWRVRWDAMHEEGCHACIAKHDYCQCCLDCD